MAAPTLNPTYDTGARGKIMPAVSHPPERGVTDDSLRAELPDMGLDVGFVADMLSAVLTHERGGRRLYRSVEGRTQNPVLRSQYAAFGEETEHHAAVLEGIITAMGGDPQYVSPAARATEAAGKRILESTYALAGSLDIITAEMAMLDGVLLAESIDHANWTSLDRLVGELPEGDLRDQFRSAVDEVLADEEEHLGWARDTRMQLIALLASDRSAASDAQNGEARLARIRDWFS